LGGELIEISLQFNKEFPLPKTGAVSENNYEFGIAPNPPREYRSNYRLSWWGYPSCHHSYSNILNNGLLILFSREIENLSTTVSCALLLATPNRCHDDLDRFSAANISSTSAR